MIAQGIYTSMEYCDRKSIFIGVQDETIENDAVIIDVTLLAIIKRISSMIFLTINDCVSVGDHREEVLTLPTKRLFFLSTFPL